jgi:predicted TIM-barrel fold metal-dependent hydrolase
MIVDWRAGHPRAREEDAPRRTAPGLAPLERAAPDVVIAATLAAMDAAGVDALVIDEWLGHDDDGRSQPGRSVGEAGFRWDYEFSSYAAARYPERFAFLTRAHPLDPDLDSVIDQQVATPGMRCLRVDPMPWLPDAELFRSGGYAPVLAAARRHDAPVMVWSNGLLLPNIERYLREFDDVQFVIDHMGTSVPPVEATGSDRFGQYEVLFALGRRYANLAVKWSRTESQSAETFPYRDVMPYLVRALEVFGPRRILWASDQSDHKLQQNWAQAYWWILESDELSLSDKEWILGRTARTMMHWPAIGDEIGTGLYFNCSSGHPAIRVEGTTESAFVANMEAHLERWHLHRMSREQILARARH